MSGFVRVRLFAVAASAMLVALSGSAAERQKPTAQETTLTVSPSWESEARLRHGLKRISGRLTLGPKGVAFISAERFSHDWPYLEIETLNLAPHEITLTDYANRRRRLPGGHRYRFDLETAVPPAIAAELAWRVAKPTINADPDARAPGFAAVAARHRARTRGSNGVLRFREAGIDYLTERDKEARSWRWADIQTLALPDPYHLRVAGHREIYEFDLKQPMSTELFDRLWDYIYGRGLNLSVGKMEKNHETQ